jgi:diacylglycerol kinase family enzyme
MRALENGSRVIAVGGDGTLHHLLAPALERRLALGLVPMGSGNDSARAFGLHPMSWIEALTHALHAPATAIDTGELSLSDCSVPFVVPFVSSLCAGFDAAICARAVAGPRWLRGTPRYLWHTLRELTALRIWTLRVIADAENRHEGAALFASTCNTPTFGSGMPAVPHARIDDGRLDLLIAGAFDRPGVLRMLPRLLAGTHLDCAGVTTRAFTTLRIESDTPIPIAADGEPLGTALRFDIRVRPASLAVVAGAGAATWPRREVAVPDPSEHEVGAARDAPQAAPLPRSSRV